MGTGARTFMTSGLPHVVLAGMLLVTTWPQAMLAGTAFGAGRAWMTWSRLSSPDSEVWDESLARGDGLLRRALTLAVAIVLVAAMRLW